MTTSKNSPAEQMYAELKKEMVQKHGEMMTGSVLYQALGFQDGSSFRQARHRELLTVHTFNLPNRKGCFALTREIAQWLVAAHKTEKHKDSQSFIQEN